MLHLRFRSDNMSIEFNENHLKELTEISERSKSNSHRLDEVEDDIKDLKEKNATLYEMSASIKNLSEGIIDIKTNVKEIKTEQGEMKNEIQDLKNSPTKTKAQWVDNIGRLVITSIVTGIVAFLLGTLSPSIFG